MADPDPSKWRKKRCPNLPPPPNPNARTSTPKPNPLGNNPGVQNFDLSDDQFTSDGIGTKEVWKEKDINSRVNDKKFLELLTEAYNKRADLVKQWSGQSINFEGEPPKGYALFKKSDNSINGHPSSKSYRSAKAFVDHLHAIMTESLDRCVCELCAEARAG